MKFGVLAIVCGIVLLATDPAKACSCAFFETIEDHVASADLIFRGQAQKTTGRSLGGFGSNATSTTFFVEDLLKGDAEESVTINHSKPNGANCGIGFKKTEQYNIFAYRAADGAYHTSICSGTTAAGRPFRWSWDDYRNAVEVQ